MNRQHNLIGEEIVIAWILALVMKIATKYLQAFSKEQIMIALLLETWWTQALPSMSLQYFHKTPTLP